MRAYRVVSDGIRYRVQVYMKRCYWRKHKWVFCGINHPDLGFVIEDYYALADAQKAMEKAVNEERAAENGYQPVSVGEKQ